MSDNPYSSSNTMKSTPGRPSMTPEQIREKVKLPAIFMLIGGLVNMLISAGVLFFYAYVFLYMQDQFMTELDPRQLEDLERAGLDPATVFNGYGYTSFAFGVLAVIGGLFTAFAAVQMMRLKSWGISMTGAILSLIPCFGSMCCLIGIPVGIFAIMTLSDSDVKFAFKQKS